MKLIIIIVALLAPLTIYAEQINLCGYPDKETKEMEQFESCGNITENGVLTVSKKLMEKVLWSKYGMECIFISHPKHMGWYYINQNGIGRGNPLAHGHDCEWFQEGLAVGVSDGKVVFFNQALSVVKTTKYTWASDFEGGVSKVCTGELIKEYDMAGEHFGLKGGQCGFINRKFEIVVPIRYPHESTPYPGNT